jgi:hypothetical protein
MGKLLDAFEGVDGGPRGPLPPEVADCDCRERFSPERVFPPPFLAPRAVSGIDMLKTNTRGVLNTVELSYRAPQ